MLWHPLCALTIPVRPSADRYAWQRDLGYETECLVIAHRACMRIRFLNNVTEPYPIPKCQGTRFSDQTWRDSNCDSTKCTVPDCWGGGFNAQGHFVAVGCLDDYQPYMTGFTRRSGGSELAWNQYTCCPPDPHQSLCMRMLAYVCMSR